MSTSKHILLCLSGFMVVLSAAGQELFNNNYQNKLNIDVYYESLCPDSQNFIRNQLHPSWNDISEYVNLKFVPFGKSISLENGTKFACQHGSAECKGNRIMSCALNRIPDQTSQVEYVTCFMKEYRFAAFTPEEFGQQCAEKHGLNFNNLLEDCYQTKEGTQLQLIAEDDTKKIAPKFIPTIVYDGVFNQQLQDQSQIDFAATVCKLLKPTYPEACNYRSIIPI